MSVVASAWLTVAVSCIGWPALVIIGGYADDPQNYFVPFVGGWLLLFLWWF